MFEMHRRMTIVRGTRDIKGNLKLFTIPSTRGSFPDCINYTLDSIHETWMDCDVTQFGVGRGSRGLTGVFEGLTLMG